MSRGRVMANALNGPLRRGRPSPCKLDDGSGVKSALHVRKIKDTLPNFFRFAKSACGYDAFDECAACRIINKFCFRKISTCFLRWPFSSAQFAGNCLGCLLHAVD